MSLLPASMKKIQSKMKALEWTQHYTAIFMLVSVSGRNLNSSKLSCMSSLPARMRMIDSKVKELGIFPDAQECSQDFSHYNSLGIFPDAQGQLTPQLVRSGRISNSSEMLWMFSLPASMKKIRSKMKALEWTQHFPHYNPMGAIRCHGHQSSDPIWPKTPCSLSPTPMMVQLKFRYDWPTGCGDIRV